MRLVLYKKVTAGILCCFCFRTDPADPDPRGWVYPNCIHKKKAELEILEHNERIKQVTKLLE
ncbi:MAG: hypothetical protein WAZ77_03310 [Candidatus Nitrosopolaris sp.]|jgi:hypothetical protein